MLISDCYLRAVVVRYLMTKNPHIPFAFLLRTACAQAVGDKKLPSSKTRVAGAVPEAFEGGQAGSRSQPSRAPHARVGRVAYCGGANSQVPHPTSPAKIKTKITAGLRFTFTFSNAAEK